MYRVGLSPAKTLLWKWVKADLDQLPVETAIDAACGDMANYHYFSAGDYIGIDIDGERLERACRQHPQARGVHASIIEANVRGVEADLVVCVETLNVNTGFDSDELMDSIAALVSMTRPGGTLLFNVGRRGDAVELIVPNISLMLGRYFDSLTVRRYGLGYSSARSRRRSMVQLHKIKNVVLAEMFHRLPRFRTGFGKRVEGAYFRADNRSCKLLGETDPV